jgi:4-alpha-glucanotransferase
MSRLEPGAPYPLGATRTDRGVNFAVFSETASRIFVCVHGADGGPEIARHELTEHTDGVFHGLLPGAGAGLVYGLRAEGPADPDRGLRFNPNKLLLDPYARQVVGQFQWTDAHHDTPASAKDDNARYMLKAMVPGDAEDHFDWQGVGKPGVPLDRSVLYEVHVKGFTQRHPAVPPAQRGTYEGFASPPAIAHLKRLGITAVSLLPVHQSISEHFLTDRGLVNYWGYNTIGFFAPDRRLARANPIVEFKTMVRELHRAGIEVILDVVYNHTCEGDHRGPTLSFKGLDNRAYYHLRRGLPSHYENFTGTGNSLNLGHPRVLQMVMDSLRYWVTEMQVDGFRFDLATTLARQSRVDRGGDGGFDREANFFHAVRQDPVLSRVKLIAEPWDIGPGGYQVGAFPAGWMEWNDQLPRHGARLVAARAAIPRDVRARFPASSARVPPRPARAHASVNFVTAHDGFTLRDLVSYDHKHNDANGEAQPRRHHHNRQLELRRRGPDRRPRRARACAMRLQRDAARPRCCAPRARRCCSPATRSATASAATTTPTARTTRGPTMALPAGRWRRDWADNPGFATSLTPGRAGSGDFGPAAYRFVDWMAAAGQHLWQVLPLGPTGPGNSPYMSPSALALNPLLIDLTDLVGRGWLRGDTALPLRERGDDSRMAFGPVSRFRMQCLREAVRGFAAEPADGEAQTAFRAFCGGEVDWLDDYALFMALSTRYPEGSWTDWPRALSARDPAALSEARTHFQEETHFWKFVQWTAFRQWQALKAYANGRGIRIVGDLPIFVAMHSADVWASPGLFDLDGSLRPRVVAGVPPDYFSATGQLWGNPLYRWERHADEGFAWWIRRMRSALTIADIVRVDHFRGFAACWEVPADAPNAIGGQWVPGPGIALFDALTAALGSLPIIAEDLGVVTPDVTALREAVGLPGMRILQFAFGDDARNPYLPHNHAPDTVVYSGTHDNDTSRGWFASANPAERVAVQTYLKTDGHEIQWDLIHVASQSVARLAVYPMQDVLGLGAEARMNRPGDPDGCWGWRFSWPQLQDWQTRRLWQITAAHGRMPSQR